MKFRREHNADLDTGSWFGSIFVLEDGNDIFLRIVGRYSKKYTVYLKKLSVQTAVWTSNPTTCTELPILDIVTAQVNRSYRLKTEQQGEFISFNLT
jgi:hypothetical protein